MADGYVLDASALLALLQDEPGADQVAAALERAVIGAANLSEAASVLIRHELDPEEAERAVATLGLDVVPVDEATALLAARMTPMARPLGLSLGDRLCLAAAVQRDAIVLTTDRAMAQARFEGLGEVRLVR